MRWWDSAAHEPNAPVPKKSHGDGRKDIAQKAGMWYNREKQ